MCLSPSLRKRLQGQSPSQRQPADAITVLSQSSLKLVIDAESTCTMDFQGVSTYASRLHGYRYLLVGHVIFRYQRAAAAILSTANAGTPIAAAAALMIDATAAGTLGLG